MSRRATRPVADPAAVLLGRASVREFRPDPVDPGTLDRLLAAALRAPTSFNFQAYSLVVVQAPGRRARLAELTGKRYVADAPVFVAVCADLARLRALGARYGRPVDCVPDAELTLTAVVDASLAGMCLSLCAESLALGTVMVGAIRNRPLEVAELLGLPPDVTPLFGLCIGWPASRPARRPRLRPGVVVHRERYLAAAVGADAADEAARLWKPDGAVSAAEVAAWRGELLRGLGYLQPAAGRRDPAAGHADPADRDQRAAVPASS